MTSAFKKRPENRRCFLGDPAISAAISAGQDPGKLIQWLALSSSDDTLRPMATACPFTNLNPHMLAGQKDQPSRPLN